MRNFFVQKFSRGDLRLISCLVICCRDLNLFRRELMLSCVKFNLSQGFEYASDKLFLHKKLHQRSSTASVLIMSMQRTSFFSFFIGAANNCGNLSTISKFCCHITKTLSLMNVVPRDAKTPHKNVSNFNASRMI